MTARARAVAPSPSCPPPFPQSKRHVTQSAQAATSNETECIDSIVTALETDRRRAGGDMCDRVGGQKSANNIKKPLEHAEAEVHTCAGKDGMGRGRGKE